MEGLHLKCYVLKTYLYINYIVIIQNLKFGHQMAEKPRGSLLGVSFLNMNYLFFRTVDGNMGPVFLSVLHSAALVFH